MSVLGTNAALAAVCAGAALGGAGWQVAHPARSPRARLSAYLEVPRVHLGGAPARGPAPVVARVAMGRILGPPVGGALALVGRVVPLRRAEDLELSLRRAGMVMSVDAYRREYLRWVVGAPFALGCVGVLTARPLYVMVFFVAGIFTGARRLPERVKAQTKRRSERVRGDLPTVAAVLALKIENNRSLVVAVAEMVPEGSGPVIEDLGRAVHLINAGYGETAAFELLGAEAAEPAAARFYRFLAAASAGGLDLARALLDQANELRVQRREEVERSAARRQMSLVVPNLVFMAPVLFVFMLAPLPQLLFAK